ncbi:hypothetical protein HDV05_006277 [Chytridiales sp. JEL 0842]|nr:hypothetical protein HDV05_006277 [Chytridiales sp. JEL 0842]
MFDLTSFNDSNPRLMAFLLSFLASLGTFLGGLLVVLLTTFSNYPPNSPSTKRLVGTLQAFSAGVMLYMTFVDLLPEAKEVVGAREAMGWFFVGVAGFGVLEGWVLGGHEGHDHSLGEEDEHHHHHHHRHHRQQEEEEELGEDGHAKESQETEKVGRPKRRRTRATDIVQNETEASGSDSSASPARSRSARERQRSKQRSKSTAKSPASKGERGGAAPAVAKVGLKEELDKKHLLRTSLITFYALLLHNMPEGLGVYLSALNNVQMGLKLAVAICLHNVPEGMAVAIPLYAAQTSTPRVLLLTLLNGLAEPLGVLLGAALLGPYLTPALLSRCLAAVGGIMACISIHELIPTAVKYAGQGRASVAVFVGMGVVFLALEAVGEYFGHAHSHGGSGHSHAGGGERRTPPP